MSVPKGAVPKGAAPKGVIPKKSSVLKPLPPHLRDALEQLPPTLLAPVTQPFYGVSSSVAMTVEEKKEAEKEQENPLLHPAQTALKKKKKSATSEKQPMVGAPASLPKTRLRLVKRTGDMRERNRSDLLDADVELDLDEIDPIFTEYREKQDEIESANPYQLETEIYTPINRRTFYKFVDETYSEAFKILPKPKAAIDENACQRIDEAKRTGTVEAFSYQKFITEYLRQASPYRGLLVYHGLGSGKTCSAIAAAEALYGTANKKIIVMTPFSLRPNFISEVSFCGFKHFSVHNHWVRQPLATEYESTPVYLYAQEILSLSDEFLRGILRRPDEERRVIWIPDFTKPSNFYDDAEITAQERVDIRAQITNSIENRINFISYNGITAAKLKEYACHADADGNRFFDNAIIVVDEIHNLIRLMQGNIVPFIVKRSGRIRTIPVEPIVPGRWKPSLCDRPLNYKRAYLFYRLLTDARNSKIIGLSGTPIINFPEELGILANVLAGYTECVKFVVDSTDDDVLEDIRTLCEQEDRVDIVRYEKGDRKTEFLVSVFYEGYVRADGEYKEGEDYVGVQFSEEEEAQESIHEVYPRIKEAIQEEGNASILSEEFVSYPRLPVDDETFRKEFIHPMDLSIRNRFVLQKRITGLISYYVANNEALMPRIAKDELVRCEMSDYVLNQYTQARKKEIAMDKNKKEAGDVFAAVEMFAKMKNPSSYRFRSRALSNFAFPESIERPFPNTIVEEEEAEELEMGVDELTEIIELTSADPLNDKKAMEEVMREEEEAPEPDLPDPAAAIPVPASVTVVQEGGAGEELSSAVPVPPPKVKRPISAAKARELLESLRAKKAQVEAQAQAQAQEQEQEQSIQAPSLSEPQVMKKVFTKKAPVVPTIDEGKEEAKPEFRPMKIVKKPDVIPSGPSQAAPYPSRPIVAPVAVPVAAPIAVEETPKKLIGIRRPVRVKPEVAIEPEVKEPEVAIEPEAPKPLKRISGIRRPVLAKPEPPKEPEQEQEPTEVIAPRRLIPYKELIRKAMEELDEKRELYLKLDAVNEEGRLATYSTKLDRMIRNILQSKGSNLVYSQFKTVEGLGVLGVALKANGFTEIVIQGGDTDPYFSPETVESLRKGPASGEKRFISFTGEGSKERRGLILNIFNGMFDKLPEKIQSVLTESGFNEEKNIRGAICWVIGITGAGAEGISLKCCRSVHIMESYWNNVRLDQVKGRAIRICSHTDLPYAERDVDIYTYCSVFSEEQKRSKLDITIKTTDKNETSDENVYNVSMKKDQINHALLDVMKEAAVDCGLNSADVGDVQCVHIEGRPDQYLFDPDLEVDKRITGIQFKQVVQAQKPLAPVPSSAVPSAAPSAVPSAAPVSKPSRVQKMTLEMIRYDGEQYMMLPQPKDKQKFTLYSPLDQMLKKPLGEGEFDPILRRPSRITIY